VEIHGIVGRGQHRDDRRTGCRGEQQTQAARDDGDDRAFDEELLNQASLAGPDRQPQRHLAFARGGSRQIEIRDVRPGDQQDERGNCHQNPERPLELTPERRRAVRGRAQEERRFDEALHALR
jgi:hypothetical protein